MRALRTLLLSFLVLLLILLLLAAGLWVFRDSLATFAFHRWAESQGLEGEVARLDLELRRLEVQGLRLEEAQIELAEVHYAPRRLLQGEVDRVLVQGLRLPLDLTGQGPLLGRLQSLLGGDGEGDAQEAWRSPLPETPPILPTIAIQDARLLLNTARGLLPVTLDGELAPGGEDGRDELRLTFTGEGPAGLEAAGRIEGGLVNLRPHGLHVEMDLDWPERASASLLLDAEALRAGEEAGVVTRLEGSADELASLVPGLPEITSGQLDLALEGNLRLPPLPYLDVAPPDSWLAWLSEREITAQLQLAGQELEVPAYAAGATFFGALSAERGPEGTSFLLDGPLEVHAAGFGPAVIEALPDSVAQRLAEGASLSLHPLQDLPLLTLQRQVGPQAAVRLIADLADRTQIDARLEAAVPMPASSAELTIRMLDIRAPASPFAERLQLAGQGKFEFLSEAANGALDLALTAEEVDYAGLGASRLELDAPLRLDWLGERLHLVLARTGSLTARGFSAPGVEPLQQLDVELASLALNLDLAEEISGSVSAEAHSTPPRLTLTSLGEIELLDPSLRVEADFNGHGLLGGSADLEGSSLHLAQQEMTLTDFRLQAPLAADEPLLMLDQARLYSDAAPALFPPLDLSGQLDRDLHFEVAGRGAEGAVSLTASGQHDPEAGRGRASLNLAPLRFTPGGLQPSIFGGPASDINNASGQLQASSQVTWSSGGFNGSLRLRARDLGFTYAGTALEGVEFDFRLASLRPLRTAEPQQLTIRRIEPGISPITDTTLFLSVESSGTAVPVVRLEQGEASFTGGLVRVVSGRADPAAALYNARIELQHLDLEALMALIGLDELTGSGRISGTIPVELRGETVSVEQGLLQADGPGVIAFRSSQARSALAAGGEYVSLMFDALENFHYEELEIGLTKPPTGITRIRLRLLGANPAVLDAQPFDLNINVETNAAPLLEALAESRRLQQGVTERLWRLVR